MNRNLIEINDNYGASIDEYGNITMISKDNKDYEFKEILDKENKLELLDNDLEVTHEEIDITKKKLIDCRIHNVAIISLTLFIGAICFNVEAPSLEILKICVPFLAVSKLMPMGAIGTAIGNKMKLKRLNTKAHDIEEKKDSLDRELFNIKEKSNYSIKEDSKELVFDVGEYSKNNNELAKVKVLKLTKYK